MQDSMYQSLLSEDGLREILSGNLSEISSKTQIPESTLRRYRNGSSDIDSMPWRTLRILSEYSVGQFDVFDTPSYYFLEDDIFYRILNKVRTDYNQFVEIYNAQIYFNWQHKLFLEHNKPMGISETRYFFIEDLVELLDNKLIDVDFETLISVGLNFGIRFVFNLKNIPVDFKLLTDKSASILSGAVLKQVTQTRLNEMAIQLSHYDGVIIDDVLMGSQFLYESNVKPMLLRHIHSVIGNNGRDELFSALLLRFVEVQNANELIGYILLNDDERIVYTLNIIKTRLNCEVYSDSILHSLAGIILTYFAALDCGEKFVRFV